MSHHLVGITEIAEMLGVSRQRVGQLADTAPDFPEPEAELAAGRIWSRPDVERWIADHRDRRSGAPRSPAAPRLTDASKQVLALSQQHARLLGHGALAQRHMILGLACSDTVAGATLNWLGADLDRVRSGIATRRETSGELPTGTLELTANAKRGLDLAALEAANLGHVDVEPEHLLLGIAADGTGHGFDLLERLGLTRGAVRLSLIEAIASTWREPVYGDAGELAPWTFVRNLTELAADAPRVQGRERDVHALTGVRHAALVGEPGLGKAATVRSLAQHATDVVTVDIAALAATCPDAATFGTRLREVLGTVGRTRDAVLWIESADRWLAHKAAGPALRDAFARLRVLAGVASDDVVPKGFVAVRASEGSPSELPARVDTTQAVLDALARLEARMSALEAAVGRPATRSRGRPA